MMCPYCGEYCDWINPINGACRDCNRKWEREREQEIADAVDEVDYTDWWDE